MGAARKAVVRFERDAGAHVLRVNLADDYAPSRTFAADYCHVSREVDGIRVLFGKKSPFSTESVPRFHYLIEVTLPFAAFYNQLYKSLRVPSEPGKPLFEESLTQSIENNGYDRITTMPEPSKFEEVKTDRLGSGRATVALMFVFDDEASVDFLHLDAMTLNMASQGKPIRNEKVGNDSVRFVMAPNVLMYFLQLVDKAAQELYKHEPKIDREMKTP
jgi:hypothetical protein